MGRSLVGAWFGAEDLGTWVALGIWSLGALGLHTRKYNIIQHIDIIIYTYIYIYIYVYV